MIELKPTGVSARRHAGFTLVEVLIAATLTLVLVGLVVQLFTIVGTAASDTRAILQTADELRTAKITLQTDLANATAEMLPPLKPARAVGYFEYVEGPVGPLQLGSLYSVNINETDNQGNPLPDTTVGDPDDKLMLTVRNRGNPYRGRARTFVNYVPPSGLGSGTMTTKIVDTMITSEYAEISYFVRGNVLYRRVLLVAPSVGNNGDIDPAIFLSSNYSPSPPTSFSAPGAPLNVPTYDVGFYDRFDISAHQEGGTYDITAGQGGTMPKLVANGLADLTRREYRYGHQQWFYPYDTRFWGALGLPTLRECTFYTDLLSPPTAGVLPVARWPFPLFDTNPGALQNAGPGTQNLWAVAVSNSSPPVMFPSPTGTFAGYQTANQHVTTVPASFSPYLNLTVDAGNPNPPRPPLDAWVNAYPWDQVDQTNGNIFAFASTNQPNALQNRYDGSTRQAEDVLLNHVLSFDVRAWDPNAPVISDTIVSLGNPTNPIPATASVYYPGDVGYTNLMKTWIASGSFQTMLAQHTVGIGAYVDLSYLGGVMAGYAVSSPEYQALNGLSYFSGPGVAIKSSSLGATYDTGSFSYEDDGIDNNGDGIIDSYTNGFDDNGVGGVDDLTEIEGPTPYPYPLRGIQVKIRVFEPDSRQIREVTVTEDFLWE